MRPLRPMLALLAISVTMIAACGSPAASGPGGPTATSGPGGPTATTPAEATQPPATTGGGGGGGGANGSVTYEISGDYTASGELPFVPQVSSFTNGGWVATFAHGGAAELIQINTVAGNNIVAYGDTKATVSAMAATGCTINLTKNDASGLAGDFRCSGAVAVDNVTFAQIHVDFNGAFEGHP